MAVIKYKDKETGKWVVLTESINTTVGSPEVYIGDTKPEDASYKVWYDTSYLPTPLIKCKLPSGEWVETAGGETDAVSVQPDFEQNDSTQPNHIKNRPFYDLRKQSTYVKEPGVASVSFDIPALGFYFYKVSDLELTHDEFLGSIITIEFADGGNTQIIKPKKETILYDSPDFVICQNARGPFLSFCGIAGEYSGEVDGSAFSCNVPEVGVYILFEEATDSLPDDSTVKVEAGPLKTLDEKYIPDNLKLAWVEPAEYSAKMNLGTYETITWDGDTSSRAEARVSGGGMSVSLYKVSDQIIYYEDVLGSYMSMFIDNSYEGFVIDEDMLDDVVLYYDADTVFCMYTLSSAKATKLTINIDGIDAELNIPYPGTYFMKFTPEMMDANGYVNYVSGKITSNYTDRDLVVPIDGGTVCFQHVSDKVPTKEMLVGAKLGMFTSSEYECCYQPIILTEQMLDEVYMSLESVFGIKDIDCLMASFPMVLFVHKDNIVFTIPDTTTELLIEKAGTYLFYTEDIDNASNKQFISDLGFDDIIHKIDPKYLPGLPGDIGGGAGLPILSPGTLLELNDMPLVCDYTKFKLAETLDYQNLCYKKPTGDFILPVSISSAEGCEEIAIPHKITSDGNSIQVLDYTVVTVPKLAREEEGILVVYDTPNGYQGAFLYRIVDDLESNVTGNALASRSSIMSYLRSLNLGQVDDTPQSNSSNLVKSSGVYWAIQDKATEIIAQVTKELAPVQADYNEPNPNSKAYIKSKLVYDEPIQEHNFNVGYGNGFYTINETVLDTGRKVSYYRRSNSSAFESLQNIDKISMSGGTLNRVRVRFEEIGNFDMMNQSGARAIFDTTGKIPYPLMVNVKYMTAEFGGLSFPNVTGSGGSAAYGTYYLVLDNGLDTEERISEILYKTQPHKLPSEYINVDDDPTEGSHNPISSDAAYKMKADYGELNPEALSYVKNKLVCDEPIHPNLYNMDSKVYQVQTTPSTDYDRVIKYAYWGYYNYSEIYIEDIAKITTSKGFLNRADVRIETQGERGGTEWGIAVYDVEGKIPYPLIVVSGYYGATFNGINFYGGGGRSTKRLYLMVLGGDTEEVITSIEYKTQPRKLPSEYLNVDETPTEGSLNPISSDAVHKALNDVQNTLEFDEVPTEGSDKLIKSGAVHQALSEVQSTLEFDEEPTKDSEKLVKSKGIFTAIDKVKKDTYSRSEIDSKITAIFRYKGSLENYEDLPTKDNQVGDTYNIQNDSYYDNGELRLRAGDNVVYYEVNVLSQDAEGNEIIVPIGYWDILTGIVDLTDYAQKSEIPTKLSQLLNDGNYLTETDKDLYIITEENKDEEIPDHISVVLDTTTTEEDEFVDLSEFMRNVPITEEDNGKTLKVQDGKWSIDNYNTISTAPQALTIQEQKQARQNINASEVWTISKKVDQLTSATGFDKTSIVLSETPNAKHGLIKVCDSIFVPSDFIDKPFELVYSDGTKSQYLIDETNFSTLTENGSILVTLDRVAIGEAEYSLDCFILAPGDENINFFSLQNNFTYTSGMYLSYIETENLAAYLTINLSAEISVPVSKDYLNLLVQKADIGVPNGLATLNSSGIVPIEQLPETLSTQSDWNEFDENSVAFIKNKPFGENRYSNDICWDGNLATHLASTEVSLAAFDGSQDSARYIKVSNLLDYNKERPEVLNQDFESLSWFNISSMEVSDVDLDPVLKVYDAGDDGVTVCAYISKSTGVPMIYFVASHTTKAFTNDISIEFPCSGIFVLHQNNVGYVSKIIWKVESFRKLAASYIPDDIKLPEITEADEGKILKVVNGKAEWVAI